MNVESSCRKRRRLLRTLFLFLASTLIVAASASVIYYMNMKASPITVDTLPAARVMFVSGNDSAVAGASIGSKGEYVTFYNMSGYPNCTKVYEDAVGIYNNDTAHAHKIELKFDSWNGQTTNIDYIYVKIFDGATQQGATIVVGTAGSTTGELTILAGATWRVQWEIQWGANAQSSDQVDVTLHLFDKGAA